MRLGSAEVYEELARRLALDPTWTDKGRDISCTMSFSFDEPIGTTIYLRFDKGRIDDVRELLDGDSPPVEFAFSGPADVWRCVFAKETSASMALMTGRLKLVGKKSWLLGNMSAFMYMLDTLTGIELT